MTRSRGGRRTNLALLALTALALVTGGLAFGIGGGWVRWIVAAHAVAGIGIALLAPWKATIAARGVRRRRDRSIASIVFAVLIVVTLLSGVAHSTGIATSIGPVSAMQLHVGAAIASLPLAVWHLVARRTWPRRTDVSRRNLLRAGAVAGGAAAVYGGIEAAVHVLGLPGSTRRATGSYERGSGDPDGMPVTQWLDDDIPAIDPERWHLEILDGVGRRSLTYEAVASGGQAVSTVLDCTGGWFAEQRWQGIGLDRLLERTGSTRSIVVTSVTGYGRRFPVSDAGRILLATAVAGTPLSAGHGFPDRLVVPGRRGFWWVKWVERIELSEAPWWWQAPFPVS
jgi:DMSO/TMAO reductase YedYZ molybdopterin-dependent catalytic subunit